MDPLSLETPPALRELTDAEAPFAGVLRGGEDPVVWVDAAEFGASPAWSAVDVDHILAPLDSAGAPDGARVILPHCPLTLDDVVRDVATPDGVLVTIAVSALRGAAEADRLGADSGRWWVSADGRPVLALTGTLDWRRDTVELLGQAIAARRAEGSSSVIVDAAVERAAAVIGDARRLTRELEELEGALFAAAEPEPLPTHREDVVAGVPSRTRAMPVQAQSRGFAATLRDLLTRLVDAGVAHRASGAVGAVASAVPRARRRSVRESSRPAPRRRRVLLVAGAAATAVIVCGALWPSEDAETTAALGAPASESPATPSPASSMSASPPTGEAAPVAEQLPTGQDSGPEAVVSAARGLIAAVASCADEVCRAALWEDGSTPGELPSAEGDYSVQVVDEYGGAAAVKVVSTDLTQVLVMVRVDEKWLVREVYDLADQP
ncbi:hypothetical protein ACIQLK_10060 [Microbacterium sp. NPDC091382]|uniref:hypothetical protein n=1 Tax=Microbacterium sp. NPDC091382 TaxID=3364210 RepID=UPI00381ADF44